MPLAPRLSRLLAAGLLLALPVGLLPATAAATPNRAEAFAGARRPAAPAEARAQHAPWPSDAEPGLLLVTAAEGVTARTLAGAVTNTPTFPEVEARPVASRIVRVRVPAGQESMAAASLQAVPGALAVEPVRRVRPATVPNDPDYARQWAHARARAEEAWSVTPGSRSVRLAVVDTGVYGPHPDLAPNLTAQIDASTGVPRRLPLGSDNERCQDGYSHGTQVAGVAGAAGDNGLHVAGAAWEVGLIDVAVLSGRACSATDDVLLAGIQTAIDEGADILNLSLGVEATACPTAYQTLFDEARAAGVAVIAAAGNAGPGTVSVPASCNGVISVGGTRTGNTVAGYSATNRFVDLVAPGGDSRDGFEGLILSTSSNGRTEPTQGTSFAAAYVAGVAALLHAASPARLTPDQIEWLLEDAARDLGAFGRDEVYGWGLVQAGPAVMRAAAGGPVPGPAPDPAFPVGDGNGGTTPPPREPELFRVSAGEPTEAVRQAVAVSQEVFADYAANHVVIARRDDYADALAGSALGFGVAPLLFTAPTGPLAAATRAELQRVLPAGGRVYLLGGPAALPTTLEGELRSLGYEPRRLAGGAREDTAVRVAEEVRRLLPELGYDNPPVALLATRGNWPDAVAGGSLAAFFGVPVLLTAPDRLHPATAQALEVMQPQLLYGVGGTTVLRDSTLAAAGRAARAAETVRLHGPERTATAVAVAREIQLIFDRMFGTAPAFAVATNLRRADAFAHVLSASVLAGSFGAVFVPVEGADGTILTPVTRDYATGLGIDGVLAGGRDLLPDATGEELLRLLRAG